MDFWTNSSAFQKLNRIREADVHVVVCLSFLRINMALYSYWITVACIG